MTASVGVAFANAYQNRRCPVFDVDVYPHRGRPAAWLRRRTLNYQLLKTTNADVSAAHLIVPTSFGQLQKTTTAGFTVNHDINYWSNVALHANFAHDRIQTTPTCWRDPADFFSAQVAYSYWLARDWRARLSYTYRQRHDDTGTASANVGAAVAGLQFQPDGQPARPSIPSSANAPPSGSRRRSAKCSPPCSSYSGTAV